jgi:hypothetical protein
MRCGRVVVWVGVLAWASGCGEAAAPEPAAFEVEGGAEDAGAPEDAPIAAEDVAPVEADGVDGGEEGAADAAAEVAADVDPLPEGAWRSALYPEGWEPGYRDAQGWGLQDFSWAGYRKGEEPEIQEDALVWDVRAFGAVGDGSADATGAFQGALDAAGAAGGGVVFVPEGLYRVDDRLVVRSSGVALRGEGPTRSRIYFTRWEGMSDLAHLSFQGAVSRWRPLALASDAASGDSVVEVESVAGLEVGDSVAVGWTITPAFIKAHGMQGTWRAFNDLWIPFFRREIIEIHRWSSPPRVVLDMPLRYAALRRDGASLRREGGYLREVGVEGLGLSNAVGWAEAWTQPRVALLQLDGVADGWVRQVQSFASPLSPVEGRGVGTHLQSAGVRVARSKRVTVAEVTMERAQHRGSGGNGYLFEVTQSGEVLFRDCVGRAGRHNFIQNWGFGTTGCVWLRVHSSEGGAEIGPNSSLRTVGISEFHHSLSMGNLIDSSTIDDGWGAVNRRDESTGAGHTATESVLWNTRGSGVLRSYQYGAGYVIGTGPELEVKTGFEPAPEGLEEVWEQLAPWGGTAPEDRVEGLGRGADLVPSSLYEDQRARRRGR